MSPCLGAGAEKLLYWGASFQGGDRCPTAFQTILASEAIDSIASSKA
ncbi:hypothetical protein H6F67_17625 [Microcoleus sp. FACHB-1515]|nr:hypothetical protein [Microcoleus sp. FACHB-1515]MBD2091666.1 hypothetical protein [Microcoleus sp. FACHB-1515]